MKDNFKNKDLLSKWKDYFLRQIEHGGSLPLFLVGLALILLGTNHEVLAQSTPYDGLVKSFKPLDAGVCAIFNFVEGSYGALLTTTAGIVAIAAAAFGKYSQAYNMLIVAVGCFILRSFISLFFADYACTASNFHGVKSYLDAGESSDPEPKPEPEGDPEPKPEPGRDPEPKPEPEGDPEPKPEPSTDPKPNPLPTDGHAPKPGLSGDPVPKPQPTGDPKPN